jgi:hypothetical protein
MASSSSSSGGIGVVGLLGVVFVVLKLTGYINWSWWYVTLPFWGGGLALVLVILAVVGACYGIKSLLDARKKKARSLRA